VSSRAIVMQQKTQRPVQFEITEQTRRLWKPGYIRPSSAMRTAYFRAGCTAQIISPPGNTLESSNPG